jgi:hypothetical protein
MENNLTFNMSHEMKIDMVRNLKTIQEFTKDGTNMYIYKFLKENKISSTIIPVLKKAGILKIKTKGYHGAIGYIWSTINPNIYMAEKTLIGIREYINENNEKARSKKARTQATLLSPLEEKWEEKDDVLNDAINKSPFDEECENQDKQWRDPLDNKVDYSKIDNLFGKPLLDFEVVSKGTNDKLKSLEKENDRLSNIVKDLNKELVDVHAIRRQLEKQKETNKTRCFNVLWGVITIKW